MNDEDLLRYSRQIMLPEIEIAGQEKLLAARVLIIGMGGLGSPIALYLAASGIGHLSIADDDEVELSNLQRQIAHGTGNIGQSKVQSAKESILDLNPNINVRTISERFTANTLRKATKDIDLVIDATDNFASRVVINKVCVAALKPAIFGAAIGLEGQILVYDPVAKSACYQCLYKDIQGDQGNCAENGVASPVVGIVGSMQAMEAIRILLGIGASSGGYLQVIDAKYMEWRKLKLSRSPTCPTCR